MTTAATRVTYPALWFTSGTPLTLGQRECQMERFLGYHAGVHGTGFRRRATAIPLATGAGVHEGIGLIGQWLLDWQGSHVGQRLLAVPDEVTAWAAADAAQRYAQRARTRGLELTKTDLDAAAAIEQLILEQATLIEAQVWIYALARLPVLLSQARVLDVEREEGPVLDCTCGLGNWVGQWTDHQTRGCAGIVLQDRVDLLFEIIDTGAIAIEEVKTKAVSNYGWEQQWEHNGQLWLHMEAASHRLGKPVTQAFVPVLFKGKRERVDRDDKASPRIQQSPLCYGWYDEGAAPLRAAEWSSRYKFVDDYGKWHTLPRTFKRTAIWDERYQLIAQSVPRQGASRVEVWVKDYVQASQYPELLQVLGPFPKPAALVGEAQKSVLVEERGWRAKVTELRNRGLFQPSDVDMIGHYTAADFIPRSWACTKFSGDKCQFFRVCHREPGWENIETIGDYEIRTPHHLSEKEAMAPTIESLGLHWPDDDDENDNAD